MKYLRLTLLCAALAGCTSTAELEPLPGSLTYGETASTRKTQAAPGTKIPNRFIHEGRIVYETYEVQPDHTYKLIRRTFVDSLGD
ncbi:hypothetical protein [Sinorhizobium saheli]|uniref:Transmembrane protein n=1 Tax=Sinorhizobium saheli TaxID=36856 RepID=A0A178Y9V4_SINSA|nr:hypothetical protein [Sinorhizobium saheli]MQW90296.1 hypothetical protein [Sinorhizobium saheli]OAP44196.1 hypothetical protein ATB98_16130 [Sinorhizobium saheli]